MRSRHTQLTVARQMVCWWALYGSTGKADHHHHHDQARQAARATDLWVSAMSCERARKRSLPVLRAFPPERQLIN